jgi:hypothetical protein
MASTLTVSPLQDNDVSGVRGKWQDTKMRDIPATVLDYWRDAHWLANYPRVEAYLEANSDAIDDELEQAERASERRW